MNKTKIEWCDCTVNPVVGCPNGCKYCYGRVINNRFHYVKDWDCPEYRFKQLKKLCVKNHKSVFIDSMSDIGCWKDEWFEEILLAMHLNSQHSYIALTKTNVAVLNKKIAAFNEKYECTVPLFVGKSITTQAQVDALREDECTDFLSVEPILEPLDISKILLSTRLIIIGAETGNRKGKVIPQKEWIDSLVRQADEHNVRVFMKKSLRKIMGDDFRTDKLIWAIRGNQ